MIYYSKSTNAFYNSELKENYDASGTWPDDAREIDEALYHHLLAKQTLGQAIQADVQGLPVLVEPVIDYQQQAEEKKNALLHEATAQIGPLQDAVELGIATDKETACYNAWRQYRVLLNRIDVTAAPEIDWPPSPSC